MITDYFVSTIGAAVKAEDAFGDSDLFGWGAGAFAVGLAEFAGFAGVFVFAYSPDCEPSKQSEECAEGADKSAIESGDNEVHQDGGDEDCEYEPGAFVESLANGDEIARAIGDCDDS